MGDDLPFRAEYAKTGRSSCKKCREPIPQNSLRLAVLVKSNKFDGKMTSWYHLDCFFERQRPKTEADIEHFDSLRWEDQETVRKRIAGQGVGLPKEAKKKKGSPTEKVAMLDYTIGYAKSGRSKCRHCLENIAKDAVRVAKKSYDSERSKMYGPQDEWHHVDCFVQRREEFGFNDSPEVIPGFNTLSKEDKDALRAKLKPVGGKRKAEVKAEADTPPKKIKKEADETDSKPGTSNGASKGEEKAKLKEQSELMYRYRDPLEKQCSKKEMQELLEYNKQEVPSGESSMLDRLADCMAFGILLPCPECKGQLIYRSGVGYQCMGSVTEWAKCTYVTLDPDRKAFKVPDELKSEYPFLKKYKYVPGKRLIPNVGAQSETAKALAPHSLIPKVDSKHPLSKMMFVIGGQTSKSKADVKKMIEEMGGKLGVKITNKIAAVIASKEDVDKMDKQMEKARDNEIQVVPDEFLDDVKDLKPGKTPAFLISKMNLASWGSNVEERLGIKSKDPKSGLKQSKSTPEKLTLKLKGGGVVDPDSELEHKAHVLKQGKDLYSVVLGVVDIQSDRNSFYKLQVLESDKGGKWWVFRAWGRVGTVIGGNKLEKFDDKEDAIHSFEVLYEEKSGNRWKNRHNFKKFPGKMYPLDVDYGEAEASQQLSMKDSKSKLPKPVQELICTIFDVESMKKAMLEFELDLTKMPLGKISRRQIGSAFGVLKELQDLISSPTTPPMAKFLDASNRFYTLIPHDFGLKKPPLINSHELVKTKLEMLDSLMEIEIAFNLHKAGESDTSKDPIDSHYDKLNAKIEVLEKTAEEYQLIETYVKNTHAPTHTQYKLEILDVFKVARQGEDKRYKPFSKLPNRRLLWHGSRTTNVAGIVSQGLRIAPPEAPVTGYMFGKGVYFADMVSKSANYCATSKNSPVGLLLLCEVALGNMWEHNQANYIEKLPKGKHSTKGVGKTEPDPSETRTLPNRVQVPLGKPKDSPVESTSLLYNEFIVYDVAQVKVEYLIKMKFNYN